MSDFSRFDADPEALAWARAKVLRECERMEKFMQQSLDAGSHERMVRWRAHRNLLRSAFIGGEGCVIAAFDERRPQFVDILRRADTGGEQ